MEPENRIDVYRNGQRIGYVYHYVDRYVAQLDKSISIRSQSFNTEEKAIQALKNFDPVQLQGNPDLMAMEYTIETMNTILAKIVP